MRHFFALPALLRSAVVLAAASQQAFSVQDDLLAFPQYDIQLTDDWLSEDAAQSKILSAAKGDGRDTSGTSDLPPSLIEQHQQVFDAHDDNFEEDADNTRAEYERVLLDGQQWLCRIPQVKSAAAGNAANDTMSAADEEKELARATDRGWELLSGMQGNCVFFISGWWSYRFCYKQGVKQFHQLPPSQGVPVYPPVEDPGIPGFMLGTYAKPNEDGYEQKDLARGESAPLTGDGPRRKRRGHGELVQRGESRYLVQKLGGGTVCDLTGKERSVEVQFHCNPQSADRISLIKETSTCHYLMVIQTPRLCNDIAFLPPQKDRPSPISCSMILREEEIEEYERSLNSLKASESQLDTRQAVAGGASALSGAAPRKGLPVGDIYVGERRLVPRGHTIEKSAIVGGGKETYVDTVASSDGKILAQEQLEKLGLGDSKAVEELKKKLEKIAEGQQWKLDVIDTPRGREYRGIIGDDDDDKDDQQHGSKASKDNAEEKTAGYKNRRKDKQLDKKREGSKEEYFHEEL